MHGTDRRHVGGCDVNDTNDGGLHLALLDVLIFVRRDVTAPIYVLQSGGLECHAGCGYFMVFSMILSNQSSSFPIKLQGAHILQDRASFSSLEQTASGGCDHKRHINDQTSGHRSGPLSCRVSRGGRRERSQLAVESHSQG